MQLPLVKFDEATETQKELLSITRKEYKMIPNMYRAMANHPVLLKSYMDTYKGFRTQSNFSSVEQEVVFLTISIDNNCSYCMAAHSIIADLVSKVPPNITDAIRTGAEIPDAKLKSLQVFTSIMLNKRGNPSEDDVRSFFEYGYNEHHILDIILAISIKIISNYTNHIFHTEIDSAFKIREWKTFKTVRNFTNIFRR
jgi:uncharacterized peroxidase-related enzyme